MPPSIQPASRDAEAGRGAHRGPRRPAGALRALAVEEHRRSFLRMVSHELRTPLNAIIGFSEIISSELYGPVNDVRYRDHAALVHESGLRLLKLVNDVLDVARLEAGTMDLDLRPEHLLTAIEETLGAVGPAATAAGVRLQTAVPADLPAVVADSRGLRTILTNLVQNAVAHAPAGSAVDLAVRAEGEAVVFEIRDRGDSVSPQDLARILKPFERGENAMVRRSEGAGLELAIVGLLCRAMDGAFTLGSTPGEGLCAMVRLPAARALRAV